MGTKVVVVVTSRKLMKIVRDELYVCRYMLQDTTRIISSNCLWLVRYTRIYVCPLLSLVLSPVVLVIPVVPMQPGYEVLLIIAVAYKV